MPVRQFAGAAQTVAGAAEAIVGVVALPTGAVSFGTGTAVGVVVIGHGGDNIVTGLKQVWTGKQERTYTSKAAGKAIETVTGSEAAGDGRTHRPRLEYCQSECGREVVGQPWLSAACQRRGQKNRRKLENMVQNFQN